MISQFESHSLQSDSDLAAQNCVRINVPLMVILQSRLTEDDLSAGSFVLEIRYNGKKIRERKQVMITVE